MAKQSGLRPLGGLKLFGESLQMRIRAGAEKNSETGDSPPFLFLREAEKRKEGAYRWEGRKRGFKHRRLFPSLGMLFILLTGLLTSLGSLSEAEEPSSQSTGCIIYERGGFLCSLIDVVDTSSRRKKKNNNEGTLSVSAVNSHSRRQHAGFASDFFSVCDLHVFCWWTGPEAHFTPD